MATFLFDIDTWQVLGSIGSLVAAIAILARPSRAAIVRAARTAARLGRAAARALARIPDPKAVRVPWPPTRQWITPALVLFIGLVVAAFVLARGRSDEPAARSEPRIPVLTAKGEPQDPAALEATTAGRRLYFEREFVTAGPFGKPLRSEDLHVEPGDQIHVAISYKARPPQRGRGLRARILVPHGAARRLRVAGVLTDPREPRNGRAAVDYIDVYADQPITLIRQPGPGGRETYMPGDPTSLLDKTGRYDVNDPLVVAANDQPLDDYALGELQEHLAGTTLGRTTVVFLVVPNTEGDPPASVPPSLPPDRPVWPCEQVSEADPTPSCVHPAGPTLNSFVGLTDYPDERDFFQLRVDLEARGGNFGNYWSNALWVQPEDEVQARVLVHNNGLGGPNALDARVVVTALTAGEPQRNWPLYAGVSAQNTVPPLVVDGAGVYSDEPIRLIYMPGRSRRQFPEEEEARPLEDYAFRQTTVDRDDPFGYKELFGLGAGISNSAEPGLEASPLPIEVTMRFRIESDRGG